MDIYFDFEATQFSERIIAIGATCEYGDFDCLVSSFKKKITPFITQLTGITKEMVEDAPTANEAFIDLWQWIAQVNEGGEPVFYHCYGESDRNFLHNTADKMEENAISRFVRKLADSMIDDSKTVCRFFHTKAIGVHKALKYFEPETPDQDHDPLNDAILLKRLMEHVENAEPLADCPYEEHATQPKTSTKIKPQQGKETYHIVITHTTDEKAKSKTFMHLGQATSWMVQRIQKTHPCVNYNNVLKKIQKAITNGTPYANWYWNKVIIKEGE